MAKTHKLKTWPVFYERVLTGDKHFEVRKDDRCFQAGDTLLLQEWDPETQQYTSRETRLSVTFVLHGGQFGIEPGYVVMSLGNWVSG